MTVHVSIRMYDMISKTINYDIITGHNLVYTYSLVPIMPILNQPCQVSRPISYLSCAV